jgi:hypothetical protein
VHSHRDGFYDGGSFKAERIRKFVHDVPWDNHELGERPVPAVVSAGNSQHLPVIAEVDGAAPAEVAVAAGDSGVEGDAVAFGDAGDVRANGGHYAGGLVPHDNGRNAAATAAVESMHVAATDPACLHPNQHLAGAGVGLREIGQFQFQVFSKQ